MGGRGGSEKWARGARVPYRDTSPLLGAALKGEATKDNRKELLIFVTPRVIETRDAASWLPVLDLLDIAKTKSILYIEYLFDNIKAVNPACYCRKRSIYSTVFLFDLIYRDAVFCELVCAHLCAHFVRS